jgi:hypothetical protein
MFPLATPFPSPGALRQAPTSAFRKLRRPGPLPWRSSGPWQARQSGAAAAAQRSSRRQGPERGPPLRHTRTQYALAVSGHCRYATALHGQCRGRTASQHQHSRDFQALHSGETVRELLTHSDNDPLQGSPRSV